MEQALADLRTAVAELTPEDVAEVLAGTVLPQTRPRPLAPLLQASAVTGLSTGTRVRLRPSLQTHLRTRPDGTAQLRLPQGSEGISAWELPAVAAMLASGSPFTASELPGVTPEVALRCITRLLRLGVLVPA